MNVVKLCDCVSPLLEAKACVVKITDRECFQIFRLAGSDAQFSVFDDGVYLDVVVLNLAEDDTASALMGEPTEYDAIASLRLGDRQPDVTAGIFVRRKQAAGAKSFQLCSWLSRLNACSESGYLRSHGRFRAAVVKPRSKQRKWEFWEQHDGMAIAIRISNLD